MARKPDATQDAIDSTKAQEINSESERDVVTTDAAEQYLRQGGTDDSYDGGNVEVTRKITCEKVVGRITQDMIPSKGTGVNWLFALRGSIRGYEEGTTTYGPFIRLKGEFIATSFLTGAETEGPTAILPSLAESVIMRQLEANGFFTPDGPKQVVTFMMEIGVSNNGTEIVKAPDGSDMIGPKKYQWAIRPLGMQPKSPLRLATDRMIQARMLSHQQRLIGATPE